MKKYLFISLLFVACTADTFSGDDAAETDAAVLPDSSKVDAEPQPDGSKADVVVIDSSTQDVFSDGKDDAPEAPEAETGAGICGYGDQGTCAHSLCTAGIHLVSGCDPDGYVAYICMFKSAACCSTSWTATCVSLSAGLLGVSCSGC